MANRKAYKGTLSSDGKQTTTSPNTEIYFTKNIKNINYKLTSFSLSFETFETPVTVRLNDDENVIPVPAEHYLDVTDIPIYKLTIIESGVPYSYIALY